MWTKYGLYETFTEKILHKDYVRYNVLSGRVVVEKWIFANITKYRQAK